MDNFNRNTNIRLNHFGSLPSLPNRSSSISPTYAESRFLPQTAPIAATSSIETALTEISVDVGSSSETGSDISPTHVLGTLRMHYHDVTSWSPSYMQIFFKIANFIGFTPYRFTMHNQPEEFGKMVPFIIVSTLTTLYSCRAVKYAILEATTKSDVPDIRFYIHFWRIIIEAILRATAMKAFLKKRELASTMDKMDSMSFSSVIHSKEKFPVAIPMILTSFIVGLTISLYMVPNYFEDSWSALWLLDYRSREIEDFFVSRSFNQTDAIFFRNPRSNLDFTVLMMGLIGCVTKFVGTAFDQLVRCIILFSALILKESVNEFNFENIRVGLEVPIIATPQIIGEQIQMRYNELKRISKSINDIFEDVIELFLLDGLLMLADFFGVVLNPHDGIFSKVISSLQVGTILVILYLAVCISKKIRKYRDWLTSELGPEKYGISKDVIQSVLSELSTNPIGIGRDTLYTNKGFLIGYFGIATGYFFSTVETRTSGYNCR